jgi:hypothetical protein
MMRIWQAVTGAKVSEVNDQAHRVCPIAVAGGMVTKLYKIIEALRADLHCRLRLWWPQ